MTSEAKKKISKIASECIRSGDQNTQSFVTNFKKFLYFVASDVDGLDAMEDNDLNQLIDDYSKTIKQQLPTAKVPKLSRVWMVAVYSTMVLDNTFKTESELQAWLERNYSGITFDSMSLSTAIQHQKLASEYKKKKQGIKRKSPFYEEISQKKRKISPKTIVSIESAEEDSEPNGGNTAVGVSSAMEIDSIQTAPATSETAPVADNAPVAVLSMPVPNPSEPHANASAQEIASTSSLPNPSETQAHANAQEIAGTVPAPNGKLHATSDVQGSDNGVPTENNAKKSAPSKTTSSKKGQKKEKETKTRPKRQTKPVSKMNMDEAVHDDKSSNYLSEEYDSEEEPEEAEEDISDEDYKKKKRRKHSKKHKKHLSVSESSESSSESEASSTSTSSSSSYESTDSNDLESLLSKREKNMLILQLGLEKLRLDEGVRICFTYLKKKGVKLVIEPNSSELKEVKKGEKLINLEAPVIVIHSDASESDDDGTYDPKPKPKPKRVPKTNEGTLDSKAVDNNNNNNDEVSDRSVVELTVNGVDSRESNGGQKGSETDATNQDETAVDVSMPDTTPNNTNRKATPATPEKSVAKEPSTEKPSSGQTRSPTKVRANNLPQTPETTPTKDKRSKFFFRLSQRNLDVTRFNAYSKLLTNNDVATSLTIQFPSEAIEGIPAPFSKCWYDKHLVQVDGQKILNECGSLASKLIVTNHHVMIMTKMLLFVVGTALDVIGIKITDSVKHSSPANAPKPELANKINDELLKRFEEMDCFMQLLAAGLLPDTIRKESLKRKDAFRKFKHSLSRFTEICRTCPALLFNDISFHTLVKEAPPASELRQTLDKVSKKEITLEFAISNSYFVQWPAAYQP